MQYLYRYWCLEWMNEWVMQQERPHSFCCVAEVTVMWSQFARVRCGALTWSTTPRHSWLAPSSQLFASPPVSPSLDWPRLHTDIVSHTERQQVAASAHLTALAPQWRVGTVCPCGLWWFSIYLFICLSWTNNVAVLLGCLSALTRVWGQLWLEREEKTISAAALWAWRREVRSFSFVHLSSFTELRATGKKRPIWTKCIWFYNYLD